MRTLTLCALVLQGLIAAANSCCFPAQWEGGNTLWIPEKELYMRSKVYTDITNKRMASDSVLFIGRHKNNVKAIVNWASQTMYLIYKIRSRTVCRVQKIKKPLPPNSNCLNGFKRLGSYFLGAGKQTLNEVAYGLFKRDYQNVVSVTDQCVPVRDDVFFKSSKWRFRETFASANWYNITQGIHTPSAFTVPPECKKSKERLLIEHLKAMKVPEEEYELSMEKLFKNIQKFEKSQESRHVNQVPSGTMHTMHSAMHNLIDHAVKEFKKIATDPTEFDDLFTQF